MTEFNHTVFLRQLASNVTDVDSEAFGSCADYIDELERENAQLRSQRDSVLKVAAWINERTPND